MQNSLNLRLVLPKLHRKFSEPKRNARFVYFFCIKEKVWSLAQKSND